MSVWLFSTEAITSTSFFTMMGEMLGDEESEDCLCIIFRNCLDMEDSVNSPIVALTNLSFSGARVALFNALKASTSYNKRILKLCNSVMLHISCLSYFDGLWDGRQMAIQLLFCGVLLLGFIQDSLQHSCVVPINLFLNVFCYHPWGASI